MIKRCMIIWLFLNLTGGFLGAQDPYLEGIARLEEGDYPNAGKSPQRSDIQPRPAPYSKKGSEHNYGR